MIDIRDARITDLFGNSMMRNPEDIAMAYAVWKEKRRILDMADKTRTMSAIDTLDEKILDILAVELRTPYYDGAMDIAVKRNMIKRTLLWYKKAGTPYAVKDLIQTIFGDGDIVEWPDYTEPPYTPGTFDIVTSATMTETMVEAFLQIIQRVKNTRSHIRRVLVVREIRGTFYGACAFRSMPVTVITSHICANRNISGTVYGAVQLVSVPKVTISNHIAGTASCRSTAYTGTALKQHSKIIIPNERTGIN